MINPVAHYTAVLIKAGKVLLFISSEKKKDNFFETKRELSKEIEYVSFFLIF